MPRVTLGPPIPALPVRSVPAAVAFYRERLGFEVRHEEGGLAVLARDAAELDLWQAGDETWHDRPSSDRPVRSGAESFLAGTGSCRIRADDLEGLREELGDAQVLHPVSRDGVREVHPGLHELSALDLDGNLLTFFRWSL